MRKAYLKNRIRKIAGISLGLMLLAGTPCYAGLPEADTLSEAAAALNEKEKKLADSLLEYDEIEDRVDKYNKTVKNNSYQLTDYKNTYGESNEKIKESYLKMASELYEAADYPDYNAANPAYGLLSAAAVANEAQARSLEQAADTNTDDYEIVKMNYELARLNLKQSAKTAMITYYSTLASKESAEYSLSLAQDTLTVTQAKYKVGMATNAEVLTAGESLLAAQQAVTKAETDVSSALKKLQLLCGYDYGDSITPGELPEPDLERIGQIDTGSDTAKALENNYTLKMNTRRLNYASSDSQKKSLETTTESNRQNISSSVKTAFDSVKAAKDAYDAAEDNLELQEKKLADMSAKYKVGSISRYEYRTQETAAKTAGTDLLQAKYQVLTALMNYDYAVEGLAGA